MAENNVPKEAPVAEKKGYDPNPSQEYHDALSRCQREFKRNLILPIAGALGLGAYSTNTGKASIEEAAGKVGEGFEKVTHVVAGKATDLLGKATNWFHQVSGGSNNDGL